MRTLIYFLLFAPLPVFGQDQYRIAYSEFKEALEDKRKISFKDAVFLAESTYEQSTPKDEWDESINALKQLVVLHGMSNKLEYNQQDKREIEVYASLFHVLTDTTVVFYKGEKLLHLPYRYDFRDIFGTRNWSSMLVTKLLHTRAGNCHSLPYLYKIICEELNVPCKLALAPNHLYIKHRAEKGGMYNTELTSASFPIDAWLMASGYITLEAIQNGIYMDTLSEKESIALCMIDLAQGYDHKYPDNDGEFIVKCCDLALQHFPNYINAMMLKAETRLRQLQQMQKDMKFAYLKDVTKLPDGKAKWDEMNALYGKMLQLGYRQMPEQMYVEWLTSLQTEKEKYTNKQAPGATKD